MKTMNRQPHEAHHQEYQIALQRVSGDESLRTELLQFFDLEFPRRLAEVRRAICEEDGLRIRKAGHALKGTASYLGLDNLRDAGMSLEKAGQEYRLHDATWILARLRAEFSRIKELRQLRAYGDGEPA
jgi:HPt (histidine-containing phosphotransfer) domain-containing protein